MASHGDNVADIVFVGKHHLVRWKVLFRGRYPKRGENGDDVVVMGAKVESGKKTRHTGKFEEQSAYNDQYMVCAFPGPSFSSRSVALAQIPPTAGLLASPGLHVNVRHCSTVRVHCTSKPSY